MRAHMFVTGRAEPLSNWLAAFPEASVVASDVAIPPVSETTVVWLHHDHAVGAGGLAGRIARVRGWASRSPVVVLANHPGERDAIEALDAGAAGYASALATPEVLGQIADVVEHGGFWVGQELMHRLLAALAKLGGQRDVAALDKLTARERDVALAVAAGASNKEISQQLDITERTVKSHLSAIFHLLDVRDRLQLSVLINGIPKAGPPH